MTKAYNRIIHTGCSQLLDGYPKVPNRILAVAVKRLDGAIDRIFIEAKVMV